MLWRVFQGCGHSFHIECNLPGISVCNICKELLATKACSLGKTLANSAVHQFDPTLDSQEIDCEEDESSDEDGDDSDSESSLTDGEFDETNNARTVLNLITQVNAWRRLEGTKS